MSVFENLNNLLVVSSIVLSVCALVARYIVITRRWPSAPGPDIAAYTNLWYLWKVSQGKFETWNIRQHEQYGELVLYIYHATSVA